jgi:hypothetical protein
MVERVSPDIVAGLAYIVFLGMTSESDSEFQIRCPYDWYADLSKMYALGEVLKTQLICD